MYLKGEKKRGGGVTKQNFIQGGLSRLSMHHICNVSLVISLPEAGTESPANHTLNFGARTRDPYGQENAPHQRMDSVFNITHAAAH